MNQTQHDTLKLAVAVALRAANDVKEAAKIARRQERIAEELDRIARKLRTRPGETETAKLKARRDKLRAQRRALREVFARCEPWTAVSYFSSPLWANTSACMNLDVITFHGSFGRDMATVQQAIRRSGGWMNAEPEAAEAAEL